METSPWSTGRAVAAVLLSGAMLAAAGGIALSLMIAGCWHDCDRGDLAAQLGVAVLTFFSVLGLWVLGLFSLQRSWRSFALYLAGLVVLVRAAEFVVTRI